MSHKILVISSTSSSVCSGQVTEPEVVEENPQEVVDAKAYVSGKTCIYIYIIYNIMIIIIIIVNCGTLLGSSMIYSSAELLKATDNFSQENIVGKGGFGVVYRARIRMCDVAVKKLTEVYKYYTLSDNLY